VDLVDDRTVRQGRGVGIWALRFVLGLAFAYVATTKITGTGNTIDYFQAIGWGQWFRYATGWGDLVGTALLFVPRLTFYGAILITFNIGLGSVISLTVLHHDPKWGGPVMVLVPLILTSLAALLAWLTRPRRVI
jgi:hypothetical protein